MNAWLLLLPLLSFALGALLLKLLLRSLFQPSRRSGLAAQAVKWIREESGLTDAVEVKKMLPLAEQHVDHFLRHKLTAAMPMVAMFIGDKTIAQFKGVFMEEMEALLPIFIQSYLDHFLGGAEPVPGGPVRGTTVLGTQVPGGPVQGTTALETSVLAARLEHVFDKLYKALSIRAIWIGGGLGLAVGSLQLAILYWGHFLF